MYYIYIYRERARQVSLCYILIWGFMQKESQRHNDKGRAKTSLTDIWLSFYCKGSKSVTQGFSERGSWRPNRTVIYWPPLLRLSALRLSCSEVPLNRRPRGPALCWMMAFFTVSYHQLVSTTSSGVPRATSAGCGFPYHTFLRRLWSPTVWLPVLTELYNSSTLTQSPTQSSEWHVWSSSSGNNCHAVHRSLSSGASVYDFFTLSHFVSQAHVRDFLRLLAIGMCHFLQVHHFGMACLPGPKVNI